MVRNAHHGQGPGSGHNKLGIKARFMVPGGSGKMNFTDLRKSLHGHNKKIHPQKSGRDSSRGLSVPVLIRTIKRLTKKKVQMASEVSRILQNQVAERASTKEESSILQAEIDSRTRILETKKNELQSVLEKELDRRFSDWSIKLEKYQIEQHRLRERARDLAEQNVSLQRKVSSFNEKEVDNRIKMSFSEKHLEDLSKRIEQEKVKELKSKTLLTTVLREKLYSEEMDIKQLQVDLAAIVRGDDILKCEVQNALDALYYAITKLKYLELQFCRQEVALEVHQNSTCGAVENVGTTAKPNGIMNEPIRADRKNAFSNNSSSVLFCIQTTVDIPFQTAGPSTFELPDHALIGPGREVRPKILSLHNQPSFLTLETDRAAVENVFNLKGIRALHLGLLYVGSLVVLLVYSILYGLTTKESNWLGATTSTAMIILRADASTYWREFTSPERSKYYYNKVTRTSKWGMPDEVKLAREKDTILHASDFESISVVKTSSLGADGSLVSAHGAKSSPTAVSPAANLPTIVASESSSLSGKVSSSMIETVKMKNSSEPASLAVANSEKIGIAVTLGNSVTPPNVKKYAAITEIGGATPSDEKTVELGPLFYEGKAEAKSAFKTLLESANIRSDCTWDQYLRQKKKLEAEERRLKQKKAREDFRIMLEEYIRDLESEEEEKRKLRMEELRKAERKKCDEFQKLMEEHVAVGILNAKTNSRDYCIKYLDDKSQIKDAVRMAEVITTLLFNLCCASFVFEELLERAREKEEKEAKKTKRLADEFYELLHASKEITASSKWEDYKSLSGDRQVSSFAFIDLELVTRLQGPLENDNLYYSQGPTPSIF
ncbi:hypothetical protein T459_28812 [Capsicum annuum]|uniref:WW domain-containing protein n=1 Tax=Capsicum annuum TaxID=4072 RepID=A0A2G2YHX2_CAPAN|nr:hypothetical protein T459_28812 [Capsicum annuum]